MFIRVSNFTARALELQIYFNFWTLEGTANLNTFTYLRYLTQTWITYGIPFAIYSFTSTVAFFLVFATPLMRYSCIQIPECQIRCLLLRSTCSYRHDQGRVSSRVYIHRVLLTLFIPSYICIEFIYPSLTIFNGRRLSKPRHKQTNYALFVVECLLIMQQMTR